MVRMLKSAYEKLKQCVIPLNKITSDLAESYERVKRVKKYATISMQKDEYDQLGNITKPCYDLRDQQWALQKVPRQINTTTELTKSDFTTEEKDIVNACLDGMQQFNGWIKFIRNNYAEFGSGDKVEKIKMVIHTGDKTMIRTPNTYLRFMLPKLAECIPLNVVFQAKPD